MPLLVADGGDVGLLCALGREAAIRKSALVAEEGVHASSSITMRLHMLRLPRGFSSSTSSSR